MSQFRLSALAIATTLLCLSGCGGGGSSPTPTPAPTPTPTPAPDTDPDDFTFTAVTDAPLNSAVLSEIVTVSGITESIDIQITGGEYQINGGDWSNTTGTVEADDTVRVRVTTSGDYETAYTATLTLGPDQIAFTATTIPAPVVTSIGISVELDKALVIGDSTHFEREKFITLHASHTENDWFVVGENAEPDLISAFIEGYDVYFGRDTGGMAYQLQQLPEDPARPGYADPTPMGENGGNARWRLYQQY